MIDYHVQHRYAYELLSLDDFRELELGSAAAGARLSALDEYCDGIARALASSAGALRPGAPVVIVVDDRRDLYPQILARAGLVRGRAEASPGVTVSARIRDRHVRRTRLASAPCSRAPSPTRS